jgi:hypothetical protein
LPGSIEVVTPGGKLNPPTSDSFVKIFSGLNNTVGFDNVSVSVTSPNDNLALIRICPTVRFRKGQITRGELQVSTRLPSADRVTCAGHIVFGCSEKVVERWRLKAQDNAVINSHAFRRLDTEGQLVSGRNELIPEAIRADRERNNASLNLGRANCFNVVFSESLGVSVAAKLTLGSLVVHF